MDCSNTFYRKMSMCLSMSLCFIESRSYNTKYPKQRNIGVELQSGSIRTVVL